MQDNKARLPISSRPWRVIAQELAGEPNPKRVLELCQELNRALSEQRGAWPSLGDGAPDVSLGSPEKL